MILNRNRGYYRPGSVFVKFKKKIHSVWHAVAALTFIITSQVSLAYAHSLLKV